MWCLIAVAGGFVLCLCSPLLYWNIKQPKTEVFIWQNRSDKERVKITLPQWYTPCPDFLPLVALQSQITHLCCSHRNLAWLLEGITIVLPIQTWKMLYWGGGCWEEQNLGRALTGDVPQGSSSTATIASIDTNWMLSMLNIRSARVHNHRV